MKGVRIINFGFSAAGLNKYMYEEAFKKLDPNSPLKVIVIGLSPNSLTPSSAQNSHYIQENTRSLDYIISHALIPSIENYLSPLSQEMVSQYIKGAFNIKDTQGYYQQFYDTGWVSSWPITDNLNGLQRYTELFKTSKVSNELIKQLMEQTKLWRENNLLVFAFRMPTYPQMVILENQMSGFNEKQISQEFEMNGGIWLDFSKNEYHSYDGSHLDKKSAVQFSRDLADQISQYLDQYKK